MLYVEEMESLLDFFFPRRSLTGQTGQWITDAERQQLSVQWIYEDVEYLRAHEIHHLDVLRGACHYRKQSLLQKAIHTLKYQHVPALADDLAQMVSVTASYHGWPPDAVLCPVPLFWLRQFSRGFNQSQLLADRISQKTHLPIHHLLQRTRHTGHQAHRDRAHRLSALGGAFCFRSDIVPSHVVLIDDLCTTGATLDACAQELKRHGVRWVEGWVVARA